MAETVVTAWHTAYRGILADEFIERRQVAPTAQRMRENWRPQWISLVAEDEDGKVVGLATEHRPPQLPGYNAEIAALYIRAGHGRSGYGTKLLGAMCELFLADGRRRLCIHTLRENVVGRSFYERAGGILVAEDKWNVYPAVWYGWDDIAELPRR